MRELEQWIWLPKKEYPNCQETAFDRTSVDYKAENKVNYKVAEFQKAECYGKAIEKVDIRFSGDTALTLYCGEKFLGRAPASSGGDFLAPQLPHSCYYATQLTLKAEKFPEFNEGNLSFHAIVRMAQARLFEFSFGHGGFFLTAHITFTDGTKKLLITDETWDARYLPEYIKEGQFNNSISEEPWIKAERISNIWHTETSPLSPCVEKYTFIGKINLPKAQAIEKILPMDKIYAGYPVLKVKTDSETKIQLMCREFEENGSEIHCTFNKDGIYECREMHSAGELVIKAQCDSNAEIEVGFIKSYYPIYTEAKTTTSDADLNLVLETCAHTLKYCRQTLHLDSPRHCELLACTGDYYIESLMTAFTYGDHTLSKFDILRTAELLRHRDGEMFHVTYSLIWVQMLWDIYKLTGDKSLLTDCFDALELLLRRFKTYIGDTGIIENPVSFMFVDWLFIDGITLHHPPKALGQTVLNMFYYGALKTTEKIYNELGLPTEDIIADRKSLKAAVSEHLYDKEKKMFFEGLNTPTPEENVHEDMPQNVEKRYYMKHSNILAAYFGFFGEEECRDLLKRIIPDKSMPDPQPYFCHFLLEAIYRNGLRDEFTLNILEQWKEPVKECSKGLVEGFFKPEPGYSFDHSHAWGGTPAWSLPLALSGMEILESGMKKLRFNPSLLGLEKAEVQIPTPYGIITLNLEKGKEAVINAPEEIEIII